MSSRAENQAPDVVEVEIFRAGRYPQGEFSEADLEELAAAYDPAVHEAPVTLDHAASGPALGWVASLHRAGDRLVARLRGVSEQLRELVRSGAYRKRSAEIYTNFEGRGKKYLRAVTFLGAGVPEVKGLADLAAFDERAGEWRAFSTDLKPSVAALIRRRLAGLLRLLDAQTSAQAPAGPKPAAEPQPEPAPDEAAGVSFREEQRREAREEARRELDAERAHLERERRSHEVALFVERLTSEGRLLPCWRERLCAFLEHLESGGEGGAGALSCFAEGQSPAAWFREWLEGLPRLIVFAEAAPESAEAPVDPAARLEELTLERMRLKPALTFGEAFREVCSVHPGLAAEYLDEVS